MTETTLLTTPLTGLHEETGASMVDYAGWSMPVRYLSDVAEHEAVRTSAGLFDLSHMAEIIVSGDDAAALLDYALVGRASGLALGRAGYSMMCAEDGGVVDDVIVYRRDHDYFMVVANAANRDAVLSELWARREVCPTVEGRCDAAIADETESLALIAVQGPDSADIVARMCQRGDDDVHALKYYSAANVVLKGGVHAYVARTGYTGEDGFELFVGADVAQDVWALAVETGGDALTLCGLAARNSLRLEAGMPLYGNELSRDLTPFDAGLGWVVKFGTESKPRGAFVGREALEAAASQVPERVLVGLVSQGRRAARDGYSIVDAEGTSIGTITSGLPSPTLGHPIACAYVPAEIGEPGTEVTVDIRGRRESMTVTKLPFYTRQERA